MASSKTHLFLLKVTLLLASTLTVMVGATISPILPKIREAFDGIAYINILTKLILTIPALFIGIGSPLAGYVLDHFGRIRLLVFSIVLFVVGGTSGSYLDSIYLILMGRILVGIAVAGIMTTVTTLIGDYFAGEDRNKFMGYQASFMAYGGVVFISLSGFLAEFSWRMPFLLFSIPVLYLPLVLFSLYEPDVGKEQEDSDYEHLNDPYPKGFVAFIYGIAFFFMASFYMIPTQLPFYLEDVVQVSSTKVGLAIACATLSGGTTSLFYTRIKARATYNFIYFLIFLAMGSGFLVISFSEIYLLIILGLLVCGFGMGMLMPNTNTCLLNLAPEHLRGRIMGGVTMSFFLGQFFSPIIFQPLYSYFDVSQSFIIAGFILMGLGIGFLVSVLYYNWRLKKIGHTA